MKEYRILKSEADYNKAIERTIEIFDAEPGHPDFDELEILLLLVKDFEDKHYKIPTPDPIEAIKFKMQEAGLKNKDLIPYIGSEGHVSAILSGKRNLTLDMARGLNTKLGIPPEVFISGK